jgi:hypothetical protein
MSIRNGEHGRPVQPVISLRRRKVFCKNLLLVPLQVDERYLPQLAAVLSFPQSVGIVGGRPGASLYFLGAQGTAVLYLDPHEVQEVGACSVVLA